MVARQPHAQLPEDIGMYVDRLRARSDAIESVWLVHPRPGEVGRNEWQLIAFGDDSVLETVRAEQEWQRRDVVLVVVTDGDRFEYGWGERRVGRLSELGWRLEEPQVASFVVPEWGGERVSAARVR